MIQARIVGFRVTFRGFLMHFGNNTVVKRQLSTISPKFLSHSWHWRGGHHWSSFGRRRFHWRWQRRRRHLFSRSHPLDLLLTNPFIVSNLFEAGPLENHGEPHTWTCSPTSCTSSGVSEFSTSGRSLPSPVPVAGKAARGDRDRDFERFCPSNRSSTSVATWIVLDQAWVGCCGP